MTGSNLDHLFQSRRFANSASLALRPQSPPPHHFPFPSPEIYFPLLSLCPLSLLSSESVVTRQLHNHSSQLVRPAPSGLERLIKQRRERLTSSPADLGPGPPHCGKLYERDTGSNLILDVVAGNRSSQKSHLYFPAAKGSLVGNRLRISMFWCMSG